MYTQTETLTYIEALLKARNELLARARAQGNALSPHDGAKFTQCELAIIRLSGALGTGWAGDWPLA